MAVDDEQTMLTTIDNPWNPFTNYSEWYAWDHDHGYDTTGYLARIAKVSNDLSDADYEQAITQAIDEIVQLNVNGLYTKAVQPVDTTNSNET